MARTARTTELPLSADVAARLARKPEVLAFVMSPVLRVYRMDVPARIEAGTHGKARLWWFGVIAVERLGPLEIRTDEHGGPVHTWRHRLTFVPLGERRCRYTDETETGDGWRGAPTRLFGRIVIRNDFHEPHPGVPDSAHLRIRPRRRAAAAARPACPQVAPAVVTPTLGGGADGTWRIVIAVIVVSKRRGSVMAETPAEAKA
ncbi:MULTISPECIES: hypothetical protein [Amycolatopsis]|uniref:hypothetical protein n=1 Tax=Amycolatopsis TaxID=1813 RepID=UPI0007DFEC07|nr:MULTISPECIES: hypothetical protein [Amycolatopsis]OAP20051.1 hypothetical protein A4R44_09233 [Amycolatopsis sp. M39]